MRDTLKSLWETLQAWRSRLIQVAMEARLKNGIAETFRRFAYQTAVLAWAVLLLFWGLYVVDHYLAQGQGGEAFSSPLSRFFHFDPQTSDAISALAGVNTAVFGIVITVVAIIVQLSAERFTGVARIFLRDRVNVQVAAYYVVTCGASVWLSGSLHSDYVPRITFAVMLSMTTAGIVMMVPYFGYVFWFLEPRSIIRHIREDAIDRAGGGALQHSDAECYASQAQMLLDLEELTDITNNSISGKDKLVASAAVDALKDLAIEYLKVKPQASDAWFSIGPEIRSNPDFVAMDSESLEDLELRRTWVEWKIMRQYLSIYNEALQSMRDVNYVIAIDTRYIGEAAAQSDDAELIALVFRYMNSYIRSALNAKDVRTTYNVLNQYRKLGEAMMRAGRHRAALDGVKHMKYYGLVAFEMNLSFVTETVAYDLSSLAQFANETGSPVEKDILKEFLGLDRAPFVREQKSALLGVRKAQVKLAAYYISCGENERARAIANDMRDEPADRLRYIRGQLENVESKDFWEIIDRGRNFEYMPPRQRASLATFFDWLGVEPADE